MSRTVRRVVLFVAGLLLILLGLALIVLPGPLTIPPVLMGVWLWSLEFEFARQRLLRGGHHQALGRVLAADAQTGAVGPALLCGDVLDDRAGVLRDGEQGALLRRLLAGQATPFR